jgi:transaldolase/glucose-6-phosphate isomerase
VGTQLADLLAAGQSIWLDNIRRNMFASGDLKNLIAGGLRGMTSNPTIFEKAIGSGNDYDAQLRELIGKESDPNGLFEALAIDDIRHACDEFRALYDSSSGADGFVSLEVSPLLANDTQATADAAQRLWKMVDRPNVMIKIPATPEGIPAITQTIARGINVNVTLIFSLETYEDVANAYVAGLEALAQSGGDLGRVASVASVFVSRIDSAVDKLLDERIIKGESQLESLLGKTGIANLKLTYARFRKIFESERFTALAAKGAHVQRPLWASTGTKNPKYSDLMYVENVVGPHTVNTLPPATLDALLDHGTITANTIESNLDDAHATIDGLAKAQISLFDVTQKLQLDGVKSFADSYNAMLEAISKKQKQLEGGGELVETSLGKADAGLEPALASLEANDFLAKLWRHDPSPWSSDPHHAEIIKNALGWLHFPAIVHAHAAELATLAKECAKTFTHVVVLGMGGSSLAPDVLRVTFGKIAGYPELHVLDSSDPEQIRTLEAALDIKSTLFIVSSKSGTTTEPEAFFRYFYGLVQKTIGNDAAGKHFIAITDPGTQLGTEAREANFLRTFENDPEIGGRYSALSYFGMLPAALAGYDIATILDRGLGTLQANSRTTKPHDAPAVRFGAAIGTLAKAGHDKLTIVTHPKMSAFGTWAEQLIAESTGKSGTGIIPIEGETLGEPLSYGEDRVFVYVGAGLPDADETTEHRLATLEAAGHPVIRLRMNDVLDIGEQFALWEVATATAGAIIGIDAFDQPNVQESKDNTKRILADFRSNGTFGEPTPTLETPSANLIPLAGSKTIAFSGDDLEGALAKIVAQIKPGDYVAFTAYIERDAEHEAALHAIRIAVRDALKVATTVGFGPRFLHSTGQLHKGGPNSGVFFQLTTDTPAADDLAIPGMTSFGTLLRAQALGDFESLDKRDRRGTRIHLTGPLQTALGAFAKAIEGAVSAKA